MNTTDASAAVLLAAIAPGGGAIPARAADTSAPADSGRTIMVQLTVASELTGLTVVERLLAELGQSLSRLVLDDVVGPNALMVSVASAEPVPTAGQVRLSEEPLTAAEIRVLRYLPTRLTIAEIGRQLYLSMHTVNSHMRHIYAKLDVHRRHEAVDRARARGLLAGGNRT